METREPGPAFQWRSEGAACALKRVGEAEWLLQLPGSQSARLSSAAVADLRANLARIHASVFAATAAVVAGSLDGEDDAEQLRKEFRAGVSFDEMARRRGCTRREVCGRLEKLGLLKPFPNTNPTRAA